MTLNVFVVTFFISKKVARISYFLFLVSVSYDTFSISLKKIQIEREYHINLKFDFPEFIIYLLIFVQVHHQGKKVCLLFHFHDTFNDQTFLLFTIKCYPMLSKPIQQCSMLIKTSWFWPIPTVWARAVVKYPPILPFSFSSCSYRANFLGLSKIWNFFSNIEMTSLVVSSLLIKQQKSFIHSFKKRHSLKG